MPNKDDFLKEIQKLLNGAKSKGASYIDINSGEVHRSLGGYPGKKHAMPSCCDAMYELMKDNDEIISAPQSGKGASLTIRYYI
ncbi:5-methylcytosine-specific restriction enzyme A [Pseudobutyrivibrio sp. 49]|uniref:hypothetical protein n=1 Tax=Pseudobutyrivibrio sp. 49 TaxID=1855344 RepID=UPI00088C1778|nr:hypothetical protein [Pseudobutyrivibrio sp. 49]SDH83380.1 5-methylcytosine-specific restriction enzyme A [Pseudobutyrivibrio sp. 49]